MKDYCIRNTSYKVLRDEKNKILQFDTATEAMRHIEDNCGNSPCLTPSKWRERIEDD